MNLLDVFGLDLRGSRMTPYFDLRTNEAANLLDGLVSVDLSQIDKKVGRRGVYPMITGIQQGRIRYRRADPLEHWKSWREIMEELEETGTGHADCEDLSSAVAAELLYNGIPARTYTYQSGPKLYHVVVKTDRWGLIDPSRAAGMKGNG
jgi:hypothetical protein